MHTLLIQNHISGKNMKPLILLRIGEIVYYYYLHMPYSMGSVSEARHGAFSSSIQMVFVLCFCLCVPSVFLWV